MLIGIAERFRKVLYYLLCGFFVQLLMDTWFGHLLPSVTFCRVDWLVELLVLSDL